MFDSIEKIEIIEEFLAREIDFDYFMTAGIIEAHYPMHTK
jgi:hypothetical protein